MPVTLSQIACKEASVTHSFGGDASLTITYDPNLITEEVFAQLQDFAKMSGDTVVEGFKAFNELLVSLIKSWDLLEDDGTVIPLTVERLAKLPIPLRSLALNMILGDIRPETMALQTQTQNA